MAAKKGVGIIPIVIIVLLLLLIVQTLRPVKHTYRQRHAQEPDDGSFHQQQAAHLTHRTAHSARVSEHLKSRPHRAPIEQSDNEDIVVFSPGQDGFVDPPELPSSKPLPYIPHVKAAKVDKEHVDIVYIYVNPTDEWMAEALKHGAANKFREANDMLRYSMRSVFLYANWFRTLHLIVPDMSHVPSWLDTANSKIKITTHEELFPKHVTLPTYNFNAIETQLHRVRGLSQFFVYMRPDMFFGKTTSLWYFTEKDYPRTFVRPDPMKQCRLLGHTVECKINNPPLPDDYIVAYNRRIVWDYLLIEASHPNGNCPQLMDVRVMGEIERRLQHIVDSTLNHAGPKSLDLHIPTVYPFAVVKMYMGDELDGFTLRTNVDGWRFEIDIHSLQDIEEATKNVWKAHEKNFVVVNFDDPSLLKGGHDSVRNFLEKLSSSEPAAWEK